MANASRSSSIFFVAEDLESNGWKIVEVLEFSIMDEKCDEIVDYGDVQQCVCVCSVTLTWFTRSTEHIKCDDDAAQISLCVCVCVSLIPHWMAPLLPLFVQPNTNSS